MSAVRSLALDGSPGESKRPLAFRMMLQLTSVTAAFDYHRVIEVNVKVWQRNIVFPSEWFSHSTVDPKKVN